jgi:hypothetical protein
MGVLDEKEDLLALRYSLNTLGTTIERAVDKLIASHDQTERKIRQSISRLCVVVGIFIIVAIIPYLDRLIEFLREIFVK